MKAEKPMWKEWRTPDGGCVAVLLFPDSMTEEQALAEVLMSKRQLSKLNEIHNEHEGTRAIEYVVARDRGTPGSRAQPQPGI